jgi:hypothetical protein
MLFNDDMSQVAAADELVPEGAYHFRISKVTAKEDGGSNGGRSLMFINNIQTEGPSFGRAVPLNCDMDDTRGRGNLKTLYKACGYNPGPEGHDPEHVLDSEFYATVKHNQGKDSNKYANIIPWTIKSVVG